ncbi:MAG: hypothetical protein IT222_03135 [Crocinitomix sp.]|nr:hypothetical protein [Crocinitomix sp.]
MFKVLNLTIILFTYYSANCQQTDRDIDKEKSAAFFKEAEVYKQGAKIQLSLYDSAIFYDPTNHEIYFKKSIWYKKTGRFIESFEILNLAVEYAPQFNLGYRAWSKLYFLRDYDGCIADLERLDTLTPNFIDYPWGECIYYLLGLSYLEKNEFNKAVDFFDKSIADQPDDFYSHHYKGVTLYLLGKYSTALEEFELASKIYPELPDLHYYKSLCYLFLDLKDEAKIEQDLCGLYYTTGHQFTLTFIQPFRTIYQTDIDELMVMLR